jgi:hypothetical protein
MEVANTLAYNDTVVINAIKSLIGNALDLLPLTTNRCMALGNGCLVAAKVHSTVFVAQALVAGAARCSTRAYRNVK